MVTEAMGEHFVAKSVNNENIVGKSLNSSLAYIASAQLSADSKHLIAYMFDQKRRKDFKKLQNEFNNTFQLTSG